MIHHLDHLVITTSHRDACIAFYTAILGMELETLDNGRQAFKFGDQKFNLHEKGKEFEPKAHRPTPGSLDLCFIASIPLDGVIARLNQAGIEIEVGPVLRSGATSKIKSVYLRDPDLNLIEISEYANE